MRSFFIAIIALYLALPVNAELTVNVIDTGPGLATVIELPNNEYLIYDTGHWNQTTTVMKKIDTIIENDGQAVINMLVLSHTDADHIAATDQILDKYFVSTVLRTGMKRTSKTWKRVNQAINTHEKKGALIDYNLSEVSLPPGTSYIYGDVIVTFLSGFTNPPSHWDLENNSERYNAGSIVMRITYKGKSVLFMGDAVGRHNGAPDHQVIATEKFLLDNAAALVIDSDVLIAGHHGADNSSSLPFINAVSPEWVIFSAGHQHHHPRQATANRMISAGVNDQHILRTDLGDDEGGNDEWSKGKRNGRKDKTDDGDDIVINIDDDGNLSVIQTDI